MNEVCLMTIRYVSLHNILETPGQYEGLLRVEW
jgi:hypothetical protein